MAVVISSRGATNLSAAGGFDVAEQYNLGMFSTTDLALTSVRTVSLTPASARNSKGVIFVLQTVSATIDRTVRVELQENIASVWTTASAVELTAAQILSSANRTTEGCITYFDYPDYAVTAAANTWRIQTIQQGGTTGTWNIRTSNGTALFYVEVPDIAGTFANNDTIIAIDTITIDQSFTTRGLTSTGDTTNAVCAVCVTRTTAPTNANTECSFYIPAPAAAYTWTVDGMIVQGAHSRWIIAGSSGTRIPFAEQFRIDFINRTVGTTASGVYGPEGTTNASDRKMSQLFYGAIPTMPIATVRTATTVSATTFEVTENVSSWQNGWRIFIGKQDLKGVGDTALYTLNGSPSWDGTKSTITVTVGLATNVRKVGGKVILLDGYGIRLTGNTTNRALWTMKGASNLIMDGIQVEELQLTLNFSSTQSLDDASYRSQWQFKNIAYYSTAGTSSASLVTALSIPADGAVIENVYCIRGLPAAGSASWLAGTSGSLSITSCVALSSATTTLNTSTNTSITNCIFQNGNFSQITFSGVNVTWTGNQVWGSSSSPIQYAILSALVNSTFGSNTYNNITTAITFGGTVITGVKETDSSFGAETANTTDLNFTAGGLVTFELASPTGNVTVSETNITSTIEGTHLRISDYNDTTNDDRNWLTYGKFVRTGSGLSDTTVRTAGSGKYAIRFEPDDDGEGINLLEWSQNVPTGNIQTLTMSVSVWCYINNTAYDAGVYTMPTLRVNYDNGTYATAVATATFGSWQRLSVNFTPATTFGQIVVTLEAATTASGSNAYVYFDDFSISYPPGVAPSLAGVDLWANAMPITPSIALVNADAGTVWDALTTGHSISGSFGSKEAKDLTTGQFLALK